MDGEWFVPGHRPVRTIGEGGCGRVVLAVREADEAPVAVRLLSSAFLTDEALLRRLRHEASALVRLDHPSVVGFHGIADRRRGAAESGSGSPPGPVAVITDLVDGIGLDRLLTTSGPLPPQAAMVMMQGVLSALDAAHAQDVVHRDVRPSNILVDGQGAVLLGDFGLAMPHGTTPVAGTADYLSPEQWRGHEAGPSSDLYAATIVLYECLTGERPYPTPCHARFAPAQRAAAPSLHAIAEPLRPLISLGLGKDPDRRPRTAAAFLTRLRQVAGKAYGDDWEERGRTQLAERAATLKLLFPLSRPIGDTADGAAIAESLAAGGTPEAAGMPDVTVLSRLPGTDRDDRPSVSWAAGRGLVLTAAGAVVLMLGGTSAVISTVSTAEPYPDPVVAVPRLPRPSGGRTATPGAGRGSSASDARRKATRPAVTSSAEPARPQPPPGGRGKGAAGTGGGISQLATRRLRVTLLDTDFQRFQGSVTGLVKVTASTTGRVRLTVTVFETGLGRRSTSIVLSGQTHYERTVTYRPLRMCSSLRISVSTSPAAADGTQVTDLGQDPMCGRWGG